MVVRFHRWVFWWFCLGIFGGIIALGNIFFLDLTHLEVKVILFFGLAHWLLGSLVCWAWEGVKLEPEKPVANAVRTSVLAEKQEQNIAAELIRRQNRLVPPRHSSIQEEILSSYLLRHWEHIQHHH
jgi:hypothetical protein